MNIAIIGTGYVGLVTGAILAELGNHVYCVDVDKARIQDLCEGRCPIFEPGLSNLIKRNLAEDRLEFITSTEMGVQRSEIVFLCVGTPANGNGKTDLTFIEIAAKDIAKALSGHKTIVIKSTVPVGTGDMIKWLIEAHRSNHEPFDVISNPEFLREGQAVLDALHPDRIVIGASSNEAAERLEDLYQPFECPIIITDVKSAEIIKYTANAFLATKISFINSVANLCEKVGADIEAVSRGVGADARIGSSFLRAGLGYGGSCFPKDVASFLETSIEVDAPLDILRPVIATNSSRIPRLVNRILDRIGSGRERPLEGKIVSLLGLSFKPDTDDMRDAKSVELCQLLRGLGARIRAYDPVAMENAKQITGTQSMDYCSSPYKAAECADALVLVTEWDEFQELEWDLLKELMHQPVVFDGRNLFVPYQMARAGFEYQSIGRPTVTPQPTFTENGMPGSTSQQEIESVELESVND